MLKWPAAWHGRTIGSHAKHGPMTTERVSRARQGMTVPNIGRELVWQYSLSGTCRVGPTHPGKKMIFLKKIKLNYDWGKEKAKKIKKKFCFLLPLCNRPGKHRPTFTREMGV